MNRLGAINRMLGAINEAPVSSEESQHPDVLSAVPVLNEEIENILGKGWWFNRDLLTLPLDSNNNLIIPAGTLAIDPVDQTLNYVQRDGKLYDADNSTFIFTEPVDCHLVVNVGFDDSPTAAQQYIAATATYRFQMEKIGDETKNTRLKNIMDVARSELNAEHIRRTGNNAQLASTPARILAGIRPYRSF